MSLKQIEEQKVSSPIHWVQPDPSAEEGEIRRVAELFGKTPQECLKIASEIFNEIPQTELSDLTEELWSKLENTDSMKIAIGDYALVRSFAEEYKRDEASLIDQMNRGRAIYAPILIEFGTTLHLLSGNTRLMLARAANQVPKVVIIRLSKTAHEGRF